MPLGGLRAALCECHHLHKLGDERPFVCLALCRPYKVASFFAARRALEPEAVRQHAEKDRRAAAAGRVG